MPLNTQKPEAAAARPGLEKVPTGIRGLDEITEGGLPKGRPTLVCGAAGCGKTMLGLEFLVHGATQYNEPGLFLAFEETEEELANNVASLGFDLKRLAARKKVRTDHILLEPLAIEETGNYNLDGLFIRIAAAIDSIGAKRIVLDTVEVLFGSLTNHRILRSELQRLFRFLKDRGITAIITGERGGTATLTRYGLEEYVADCVILLDNRVCNHIFTRHLQVVKYRGSAHGSNEYPFIISKHGILVLPVTSIGLNHPASTRRVSTGVPRLDTLLGGSGYYRGSSVLISGASGTGKSTLSVAFAAATCERGERCLYLAFEESEQQILRNMRSVGYHLERYVKEGNLRVHSTRPTSQGLESHLSQIYELVTEFKPSAVVIDPVTNLTAVGGQTEVRSMLARLIDFLKMSQITMIATSLIHPNGVEENSEVGISSFMDTWLMVRNVETNGERNRCLFILKSRGMAHSNQVREFVLTSRGIRLVDVYTGQGTVLTGSARVAQLARERAQEAIEEQEFKANRAAAAAQINSLEIQLNAAEEELKRITALESLRGRSLLKARTEISRTRMADHDANGVSENPIQFKNSLASRKDTLDAGG